MKKLVIQVVLFHGSQYLHALLRSLERQTFTDFEVLFYENSVDETELARVRVHLANFTCHYRLDIGEKNLGFSAHNILYQKTVSPYVFVLNQDAYLADDCLEKMVQALDNDKNIASATPLVMRWDEKPTDDIDSAGLEYLCLGMVSDLKRITSNPVWGVSGAVALYRRSSIEHVRDDRNLFDPRFFMYKEDVELAFRLHHAGFTSICVSETKAFHIRSIREERGFWARIKAERKRPKHLRITAYKNQWRIYRMHWNDISFKDKIMTIKYEFGRTLLFVLSIV
ncbi:MAG: glycosyltransferase [Candidatus Magasanikbacteria bacterium]|nr:glycosyltransferase [Candidatus Magasanikbacteria bacterium]